MVTTDFGLQTPVVIGGVSARERIHRGVLICDY